MTADLNALKRFVITANSESGYDTTNDFTRDFTFDMSVLFTITIMTTVRDVMVKIWCGVTLLC